MAINGRSYRRLVDYDKGTISRELYTNWDIYQAEMEQIFRRMWLFVGHESQIPKPNDYTLSRMGGEEVVVTRDVHSKVHVLLNSCSHRGVAVCLYDRGNARAFQCKFHGWTFENTGRLIGVPPGDGGYTEMRREDWGLVEARVETFQGSIWATWDHNAPGLLEFFGGVEAYLMPMLTDFGGTDNGAEVVGVMKWRFGSNWKTPSPDADHTHAWITHRSMVDGLGVGPSGGPVQSRRYTKLHGRDLPVDASGSPGRGRMLTVSFPEGHTTTMNVEPNPMAPPPMGPFGDFPAIREYIEEKWDARKERLGKLAFVHEGPHIFPNHGWFGRVIRMLYPQGPFETEIWSYFLVDKVAPPEVKKEFLRYYARWYGPAGITQKDDMENWRWQAWSSKGERAREYDFNYQLRQSERGEHLIHGPSKFGLPGYFHHYVTDETFRRFHLRWAEVMDAKDWSDIRIANPVK